MRRPRFAPWGLLACALLAVNALLVRFAVAPAARVALPIAALVLLAVAIALALWRAGDRTPPPGFPLAARSERRSSAAVTKRAGRSSERHEAAAVDDEHLPGDP